MKRIKLSTMTRMGLSLAVIILLEFLESGILRMPQGGSISFASLVFFLVLPIFDVKEAVALFLVWRTLILFFIPPFYVSFLQFILDYYIAYLGFLAVYPLAKRAEGKPMMLAIIYANIWRYAIHVFTGTLFFGNYANDKSVIVYSLVYNIFYMGPTLILQLIVGYMSLPVMANIMNKSSKGR